MDDDGTMVRLPTAARVRRRGTASSSSPCKDLIAYRMRTRSSSTRIAEFALPTTYGEFRRASRYEIDSRRQYCHVALVMGEVGDGKDMLVRVHSECLTGDALHSMRCDCAAQRDAAMAAIAEEGRGVLALPAPGRPRHRSGQQAARLRAAGSRRRHRRGQHRARPAGRQARLRHRLADPRRSRRSARCAC